MMCLECSKLDLQSNPKHAAVGLGKCSNDKSGEFRPVGRQIECGDFAAADAEVTAKRLKWWSGK